jgi:hypothetical protein
MHFKLVLCCLLTLVLATAKAALPFPIYAASSSGSCITVVGTLNVNPSLTCESMVGKLAGSCPSDTSGATYTFSGVAQSWTGDYECNASIYHPAKNNIPALTTFGGVGIASSKYFCKNIDKIPITWSEWSGASGRDKNVECPVPCPVEPLKLITDPDAIRFENGDNVRRDKLTATTETNLQCLINAVSQERPSRSFSVNSAWRPTAYQDHFYEIYKKLLELDKDSNIKIPACIPIRNAIEQEANNHRIANLRRDGSRKPVGSTSNHTSGNAFDASWTTTDARIDELAAGCNLIRPFLDSTRSDYDKPHFQNR